METNIQEPELGWVRWLMVIAVGAAGLVLLAIGPIGTREMCADTCDQMPNITWQIIGGQLVIAAAFLTGFKPRVKSQIPVSLAATALFVAAYSIAGYLLAEFYFLGVWIWIIFGIPVIVAYAVLLAGSLTALLITRRVRRKKRETTSTQH